jgi:hypothetical protein
MSSILPQINELQETPFVNARYADRLLTLLIEKQLSLEELNIGLFESFDETGSVIRFDEGDFENVQLELKYTAYRFIIELTENSNENFACTFRYKIFEDTDLYDKIPEVLRRFMIKAADDNKSKRYKKSQLTSKIKKRSS